MRASISFCLSAILLLCSTAESAQPPKTTYYLIESTMQIPEGRMLPASVALVKRVVDPDSRRKLEVHLLGHRRILRVALSRQG